MSSAVIQTVSTIQWSGGEDFDGFLLLIAALPDLGSGSYPQAALAGQPEKVRIPTHYKIPIQAGVLDDDAKVLYNAKIAPPSS